MRIALAIEHFNRGRGGAEQYAWRLAHWLAREGHHVEVFAVYAAQDVPGFAALHRLELPSRPFMSRQHRAATALQAALKGTSFDVVHGFNHIWPCDVLRLGGGVHRAFEHYNAMSASGFAGRTLKSWSYRCLPRYRALRWNEDRQFDDPHRQFIAISKRVADDMVGYYPSCKGRVHLIHNGVDTAHFNPTVVMDRRKRARDHFQIPHDVPALLFMSNNYRLKGLHDIIEALRRLTARQHFPFKLIVAGRGNPRPFQHMARCSGLDGALIFCGPQVDAMDCYAAADVLVHPAYYDAFGSVGIEAMACGLSIVISRNCGVSEIMKDGDGAVMVDMPCAPDALANAIAKAAEPSFRERAQETNWQRAQQHPLENNYRQVMAIYQQVVARKNKK